MTKRKSKKDEQISFLEESLNNNQSAILQGPKNKKWSLHDLRNIKALTTSQENMIRSYCDGNNIIANGSAGTGKSFLAIYLALYDILTKESPRKKIIIVRSVVAGRDIGFLKGDLSQKLEPYEAPYQDIFEYLLQRNRSYENLKDAGIVKFETTSFLRSITWDNAVVVVDELQNCTWGEANTIMSRMGNNSRIIVIGDMAQNDLYRNSRDQSGYEKFLNISKNIKEFEQIHFTRDDIVRSNFVKSWICAVEDYQ